MLTGTLSSPLRYGIAVLSVALALLLTLLLWTLMQPNRFLLLFVAVIFSSWIGGLRPGLLAALLAMLSDLLFLPSAYPSMPGFDNLLRLGMLVFVSLLVGSLSASRKRIQEERDALLARELAARAAAEQANRSKDEFLATVSHDLRTPLTSILIWVRMLNSGKLDEETSAHALDTIAGNVKSLSQLIDDLLDVSRIVSGKLRIDARPLELKSVIGSAINVVRPTADAKSIEVETMIDPSVKLVLGAPDRLQQVLWNLLSNAIKFTPAKGRVEVRLAYASAHALVTVRDNGCGISAESLPHIFERSFQSKERGEDRGLGLGLAIVRRLVERHGGTVGAESAGLGRGATFTVKLPLMTAQSLDADFAIRNESMTSEGPANRNLPTAMLAGLRILIVDDDRDAREVVATALAHEGAQVTEAASCSEALDAIARAASHKLPELLVSDIAMPGDDGYVLIRKVRALDEECGGKIPALALTAHAKAEDRERALRAGFQAYLAKPVELTELVTTVARLGGRTGKTLGTIATSARAKASG